MTTDDAGKQVTVAELLARNGQKVNDRQTGGRRRRGVSGGISVAELTGDIPKVPRLDEETETPDGDAPQASTNGHSVAATPAPGSTPAAATPAPATPTGAAPTGAGPTGAAPAAATLTGTTTNRSTTNGAAVNGSTVNGSAVPDRSPATDAVGRQSRDLPWNTDAIRREDAAPEAADEPVSAAPATPVAPAAGLPPRSPESQRSPELQRSPESPAERTEVMSPIRWRPATQVAAAGSADSSTPTETDPPGDSADTGESENPTSGRVGLTRLLKRRDRRTDESIDPPEESGDDPVALIGPAAGNETGPMVIAASSHGSAASNGSLASNGPAASGAGPVPGIAVAEGDGAAEVAPADAPRGKEVPADTPSIDAPSTDAPNAGATDPHSADADGDHAAGDDKQHHAPGTAREWVVLVGQALIAVAVGAGLFLGFQRLWQDLPVLAVVLAILVIIALVAVIRVLRRADDLLSVVLAVAVGALVTLGPLAMLLGTG